jgi:cytochrome c553
MAVEARVAALARCFAATWALMIAASLAHAQPSPQTLAACAACHGTGGNAGIPGFPSLAGQPRIFIENQLVLIREGLRDVPAMTEVMRGMADDQIVALARHFAASPVRPPDRPTADPETVRRGAEISRRMLCGSCHLADFSGQQQVPRLAAQNEAYLLQSMKQFRDNPGPGRDTIMAASLFGLSDRDLADLAHFLATRPP